jgi:hypothetical protein
LQSVGVGDFSVSTNKIQDNAITTAKIAAGAVIPADLSTGAPSWTEAGLLQFNSGYGSVATAYGCRAWVNFNGSGTVAIRASGNVSSITDINVGDYRINFTTSMPDNNYAVCILGGNSGADGVNPTTSGGPNGAFQAYAYIRNSGSAVDYNQIQLAVFR